MMADNTQDKTTVIQMTSTPNSSSGTGQVWWDGTHLNMNIDGVVYQIDQQAPNSTQTSGALSTTTFVSGTGKQISSSRGVCLTVPITANATSLIAATCKIELSPDNTTYSTLGTDTLPALSLQGTVNMKFLFVPMGWYVKLTVTQGSIGTGTYW